MLKEFFKPYQKSFCLRCDKNIMHKCTLYSETDKQIIYFRECLKCNTKSKIIQEKL